MFYFDFDIAKLKDRLYVLSGSITDKDFGYSISDLESFSHKFSTIIHTAAKVSHYGKYDDFEDINIEGTKNIAEFAYRYHKRLIHISSISVSGNYLVRQDNRNVDFSENNLYIGQHYTDNVYVYSKFKSETIILSYMERGSRIVLTGANGIGKSTLLKSLLGLIKPLDGKVEQGDYLHIGYFEQETPQDIKTTCIEEIWNEFPSLDQREVRAALAKCGLTTMHIESKVKVLSGGEQAKVRLCKLINRPSNVLVLDEPTNHLDTDAKDELKRALLEYKGSILMVCHEPEFYEDIATDVWDCTQWTTKLV